MLTIPKQRMKAGYRYSFDFFRGCGRTVRGIIHSTFFQQRNNSWLPLKLQTETGKMIITNILTSIVFGIVFLVAIASLKSFITVMEKVTSFSMNSQSVIFFYMYIQSRRGKNSNAEIPLPVPKWMHLISYLIPLYFGFAVIYDGFVTISDNFEFPERHNNTLHALYSHQ